MLRALLTSTSFTKVALVGLVFVGLVAGPFVSYAQTTPTVTLPAATANPSFEEVSALCPKPADSSNCVLQGTNGTLTCSYAIENVSEACIISYKDAAGNPTGKSKTITNVIGTGGTQIDVNAEGEVSQSQPTRSGGSCAITNFDLVGCLQSAAGKLGASIILIFVTAFAMLLGLIGGILNWILLITVFQYSVYFGNSEGMLVAWSVLRDLGNILLLFGFIFIGLQTILNVGHFSVSKALPRLVIFAVLINFSLFVSEAIVDTANVFSATFYTQAGQIDCTKNENMESCANDGLAGHIMKEAGLTGIFAYGNQIGGTFGASNGSDMFFTYFALLILIIIMMVVFIAACILLLIRAVVLMLLLVTSPLGFAAMAIPQFEEYSKMWWNKLIANAFFAPVFLLLVLVGLKIMDGAGAIFNSGGASLTVAVMKGSTGTGGIFILYSLIIGFMIAALMSAKSLGAMGASFAINKASAIGFGTSARVLNAGVGSMGWAMRRAGQTQAMQSSGIGRAVGGALSASGRAMENTNLDIRRFKPLAETLHHAGATDGAHPAHHASFNELRHVPQKVRNTFNEGRRKTEEEIATRTLESEAHHATLSPESAQHLAGMNAKELEALHGIQTGVAALAQNLSPEQFENLMKSETLTSSQKGRLRTARFDSLGTQLDTAAAGGAGASAASADVKRWSTKDIVASGYLGDNNRVQQLSTALSDTQYDDLMKSSSLTNAQKQVLRDAREGTGAGGRFDPANIARTLGGMSPDAVAKLPGSTLALPAVFGQLDVAEFAAIQKAGKIDRATRQLIGVHIANIATTPGDPRSGRFISYINSDPRVAQFWETP